MSSSEKVVNITFSADIDNSTAIQHLSYDSEKRQLEVLFVDGDRWYRANEVSVKSAMLLLAEAVELNSWGKAYWAWRKQYDAEKERRVKDSVEPILEGLSVAQLREVQHRINRKINDRDLGLGRRRL